MSKQQYVYVSAQTQTYCLNMEFKPIFVKSDLLLGSYPESLWADNSGNISGSAEKVGFQNQINFV